MGESGKEMTWLPEQHEEQLQLGFRIIDNAFKNKIHGLEQEIRALVSYQSLLLPYWIRRFARITHLSLKFTVSHFFTVSSFT